jgi:hypothetical protein
MQRRQRRSDGWSGTYVHQLAQLTELWNVDKHRTLPVSLLTSTEFTTVETRSGHPPWHVETQDGWTIDASRAGDLDLFKEEVSFEHARKLLSPGAEVVRIKMTSAIAASTVIDPAGFVVPRVALDGPRPVLATIDRLTLRRPSPGRVAWYRMKLDGSAPQDR